MPNATCAATMPSTASASCTPPRTLAKNATTSSSTAISGTIICPLMPCTMKPISAANFVDSLSIAALSSTPPPSIQAPSPKIA